MNRVLDKRDRAERAQHISTRLPSHIGLLTRLLTKEFGERYSLTEAMLLSSLTDGPRRITDLAGLAGLAQPTTTLLVKRLEEQGLVRRERQAHDQRVVL
ncbi:MAG: MarR family transcriptional regulator, partial [Nocardioides sp.]